MKTISFDEAIDVTLSERQIRLATGQRPRQYSRQEAEQAFHEVFDLVGGVPRLALWANNPENYGEFLKLYSKLMPKEQMKAEGHVINFVSSVPDSPLNNPKPDDMARIDHDVEDGMSEDL